MSCVCPVSCGGLACSCAAVRGARVQRKERLGEMDTVRERDTAPAPPKSYDTLRIHADPDARRDVETAKRGRGGGPRAARISTNANAAQGQCAPKAQPKPSCTAQGCRGGAAGTRRAARAVRRLRSENSTIKKSLPRRRRVAHLRTQGHVTPAHVYPQCACLPSSAPLVVRGRSHTAGTCAGRCRWTQGRGACARARQRGGR